MSRQYIKQTEPEIIVPSECPSIPEKLISNTLETKEKAQISDPIADILSLNNSKCKTSSVISTHVKTESIQHKHRDIVKVEKKKEEKNISVIEKSALEGQGEVTIVNEAKVHVDKEKDKIKKKDPEIHQEAFKKTVKNEVKFNKKQIDDIKVAVGEIATVSEESQSSASFKSNVSSKKDEKNKSSKSKSQGKQKSSISSSETKKLKRELSNSSEKLNKSKLAKSSKESLSPTKVSSSLKSVFKEEKVDSSKSKSHDPSCSKTSELSVKKSKSSYDKKDNASSKHKEQGKKIDKAKFSKSADKNEPHIYHESSNNENNSKNIQYSSSYDSSQGSDQEKNNFKGFEKERLKHFSKFVNTESSEIPDSSSETDRKQSSGSDENSLKKYKHEKDLKLKLKDTSAVEAAKISSCSNSFGSASSVSSSSNTSKDNLISNSDEVSENSVKDKKKKALKEKDSCQNFSNALPYPPPPPPPSSSFTSELTSAESVEDTQSSFSDTEASRKEDENNAESLSDSELECKDTLNENASTDSINAFYDIFLYSSSSSEFEGFGYSPERKNNVVNMIKTINDSDVSVSSVHTSDLSSFDDEFSCDEEIPPLTEPVKSFHIQVPIRRSLRQIIKESEKDAIADITNNSVQPPIKNESTVLNSIAELKNKTKREKKAIYEDAIFGDSESYSDGESISQSPSKKNAKKIKLTEVKVVLEKLRERDFTSVKNKECKKKDELIQTAQRKKRLYSEPSKSDLSSSDVESISKDRLRNKKAKILMKPKGSDKTKPSEKISIVTDKMQNRKRNLSAPSSKTTKELSKSSGKISQAPNKGRRKKCMSLSEDSLSVELSKTEIKKNCSLEGLKNEAKSHSSPSNIMSKPKFKKARKDSMRFVINEPALFSQPDVLVKVKADNGVKKEEKTGLEAKIKLQRSNSDNISYSIDSVLKSDYSDNKIEETAFPSASVPNTHPVDISPNKANELATHYSSENEDFKDIDSENSLQIYESMQIDDCIEHNFEDEDTNSEIKMKCSIPIFSDEKPKENASLKDVQCDVHARRELNSKKSEVLKDDVEESDCDKPIAACKPRHIIKNK